MSERSNDPKSGIMHDLPPAPMFTGRQEHLSKVAAALDSGPGVVSLIGLGGAGKTALAAEYLRRQASAFAKVFVWSFYVDQDASAFLRDAHIYFAGSAANQPESHGTGALYLLTKVLAEIPRPTLIILDGLERVQRAGGGGGLAAGSLKSGGPDAASAGGLAGATRGAYGEMEDPLLKRVLTRLAMGAGQARCLITSRFPVTDLQPWAHGNGYRAIDVGQLDAPAARELLRRRGVVGDDAALDQVLREFGGHALTLDHLGSYLAAFANGDPAAALKLPGSGLETTSLEEARLERVLTAYERALSPSELDLLTRVCVFRFGASTDLLYDLFARSTNGVAGALKGMARDRFEASLKRLVDMGLISREQGDCYTAHPAVRDHFYRLFADPAKIHTRAAEGMQMLIGIGLGDAWDSVVEHYIEHRRMYGTNVRGSLGGSSAQPWVVDAFCDFMDRHSADLSSAAIKKVGDFIKKLREGKWPEPPSLNLKHGVSLAKKPGVEYPTDKKIIDTLEEIIHHGIRAGRTAEAFHVYKSRLGGAGHLGRVMGDYNRGARILRAFPKCPDNHDLGWFLRGIGELEEAYQLFDASRPIWSGTPLTLLGRLPEVNRIQFWEHTRRCADILMGKFAGNLPIPYLGWGEVLIDADLCLIWGKPQQAITVGEAGLVSRAGSTATPDSQRCRLTMAEAYRRLRQFDAAQDQIDRVEEWVLRSSSVEHLIQLHLVRARLLADRDQFADASAMLAESLHLARRCGFQLYHIDVLNEIASQLCRQAEVAQPAERTRLATLAADHARAALFGVIRQHERPADGQQAVPPELLLTMGATDSRCQYRLGEADGRAALGEALLLQGDAVPGRMELTRSLELETRTRHPKTERARMLLRL